MALNWLSQIFPCLSVQRVHESTDVPDVVTETRSASGIQFPGEREYVTERRPSVESGFNTQRDCHERRSSLKSLPLEVPPPRGHEETLFWLNNGNATGVIAARDAADRSIRDSISSTSSEISYTTEETVIMHRDFSRDENGLDLFAVGTPGTATPFTPAPPSAPPTNEASNPRRGTFPREPPSRDITHFQRPPPSSSVSTPGCGSLPADRKDLNPPHANTVWPFGVGHESFSERMEALSLAVSQMDRVREEDTSWKLGCVEGGRPVLHINTQDGSQATDLSELSTTAPPPDHGRHEGDSVEVPTVQSLAAELSGLDDDSSSGSDGTAESPTAPLNSSSVRSMTNDGDSKQDVHPESPTIECPTTKSPVIKSPAIKSPTIDKLADNDNINPDVPADSPTGVSETSSIKDLIGDIKDSLDGIAKSTSRIVDTPKVDKSATDRDSDIKVKKEYWNVASDDVSLDFDLEPFKSSVALFVGLYLVS
ncbi:hypothetical protein CDV31_006078 [Fusarium ambrosium]|uniref:Uncharacterized protein n=1 Tax=Fusarium ambrosium TaxID=131363 RepID=A0A428UFB5_9HYPO|nr:hypothetical protein CDV31_006078 [Fusarium ambrosium]